MRAFPTIFAWSSTWWTRKVRACSLGCLDSMILLIDGVPGEEAEEEEAVRARRVTLSSHLSSGRVTLDENFWTRDSDSSYTYDGSMVFFVDDATVPLARKIAAARSVGSEELPLVGRGGYLTKQGSQVKNWKQRWFTLRDGQLMYFRSPRDTSPAGQMWLSDIEALALFEPPAMTAADVVSDGFLDPRMDASVTCAALSSSCVWVACESGALYLWNVESGTGKPGSRLCTAPCAHLIQLMSLVRMQTLRPLAVTQLLASSRFGMWAATADGGIELFSCAYNSLTDRLLSLAPERDALVTCMCMLPDPASADDPSEAVDPSLLCVARDDLSLSIYRQHRAGLLELVACTSLSALRSSSVRAMVSDGDSRVWLGALGCLVGVEIKTLARSTLELPGAAASPVVAMCVGANDACYCVTQHGLLLAVDMARSRVLRSVNLGAPVYSMAPMAGGHFLWCGLAGAFCIVHMLDANVAPLRVSSSKVRRSCGGKKQLLSVHPRHAIRLWPCSSSRQAPCGWQSTRACQCGSCVTPSTGGCSRLSREGARLLSSYLQPTKRSARTGSRPLSTLACHCSDSDDTHSLSLFSFLWARALLGLLEAGVGPRAGHWQTVHESGAATRFFLCVFSSRRACATASSCHELTGLWGGLWALLWRRATVLGAGLLCASTRRGSHHEHLELPGARGRVQLHAVRGRRSEAG